MSGACACDTGFEQPLNDPQSCVDIDECAVAHGGCDPLAQCINSAGGYSCGACPSGYAGSGDTACIPNECVGAPDPTCGCVRVAPDGDDLVAAASGGATPFASVDVAIDFASTHPNVARKVCVAGGATCEDQAAYPGPNGADLAMRDGVSVYGSYESTSWARCGSTNTTLTPASAVGVYFGPELVKPIVLDGFTIVRFGATITSGVTVEGAAAAELANLSVKGPSVAANVSGFDVTAGAGVTLVDVDIPLVATATGDAVGLRCIASRCSLEGGEISLRAEGEAVGIWLDDAPGSLVADSVVLASGTATGAPTQQATGLLATGDVTGVALESSSISAKDGIERSSAVVLATCTGAFGVIEDNQLAASGLSESVAGLLAEGSCAPTFVRANTVNAVGDRSTNAQGIACSGACRIIGNTVSTGTALFSSGTEAAVSGISCGEGCVEVSANSIDGTNTNGTCRRFCTLSGYGITAAGSALIASNFVSGGCNDRGGGILTGGSARIQNNVVRGRSSDDYCGTFIPENGLEVAGITVTGSTNDVDVHSNTIDGGGSESGDFLTPCFSYGISLQAPGGTFRNNIVSGGRCAAHDIAFIEGSSAFPSTPAGAPLVLENNDLTPGGGGVYSRALGLLTIAEVNLLPGASGNFSADPRFATSADFHILSDSPCRDAGDATGAPAQDIDGEPRSAPFDVGADEWGEPYIAPCDGVTCSGHGTCHDTSGQAACDCHDGFELNPIDPLACDDVNECGLNNGGCDPLTACENTAGSRECGDCPSGYAGSGETGCVLELHCDPNPCQHGAACVELLGGHTCDCPPGIGGTNCDEVFTALSAGDSSVCGLRTNGEIACWGGLAAANSPAGTFTSVSVGGSHSCAVRSDGTLACWGDDSNGKATPPAGTFVAVAAGSAHSCGVGSDGTAVCWGYGGAGATTPVTGTYQSVVAGYQHTCGHRTDGTVACWGTNTFGQLNAPGDAFEAVSAGSNHTCGLRADGTVTCWGLSTSPSGTFVSIDAGSGFTCGVRGDGTGSCWGSAPSVPAGTLVTLAAGSSFVCGLLTDGSVSCSNTAVAPGATYSSIDSSGTVCAVGTDGVIDCFGFGSPPSEAGFAQVANADQFGCGLRSTGTITCWGNPVTAPSGLFSAIAGGAHHVCAVRSDEDLVCWGDGFYSGPSGEVGPFSAVAAENTRTCALNSDGSIVCLGPGFETSPPAGNFEALAVGNDHACAIDEAGAVACWGSNTSGQASPPSGAFRAIAAGPDHSCAIRTDGGVECWGGDAFGQATPPNGTFVALAAGNNYSCGIGSDLRVRCWGALVR